MRYAIFILAAMLAVCACERKARPESAAERQHPTPAAGVNSTQRTVSIAGNVRNPQHIPWSSDLSLLKAIGIAGGMGWQPVHKVFILRGEERMTVNLPPILKDSALDPKLLPGDQVEVPP